MLDSIDFSLQNINLEQPSIWSAAYVLSMAFALSSCIALVYHLTSARRGSMGQFIQTLILGSMGAAIIVLAIGDSVGRGLGILGALAIIRFRTTLRQQRDIVFVFCSLGIGMACGMYGFNIAVIGTLMLSVLALIFRMTSLHGLPVTKYQIRMSLPLHSPISSLEIEKIFALHKISFRMERSEWLDEKIQKAELSYLLDQNPQAITLIQDLKKLDPDIQVRIWSRPENETD